MPASFQEILSSRLFQFIVGEEVDGSPSKFFVYEDAIAQLSKPLYTLTKGVSSEARAGCATWKDVSKETFGRFVQFAYTGDYSIPKTEKRGTAVKLGKAVTSVPAYPSSPTSPNGIRRRNNSHGTDEASAVEPHDRPVSVFDNELRREPIPEKFDDDSGSILTYSSPPSKKPKKKKKAKTVIKASIPEPEPEPADPTDPEPPEPEEAEPEPAPEPEPQEPEEPELADPELAEPEPEPEPKPFARQEKCSEQLSYVLADNFHSLSYPLLAPRNIYSGTCEPAADFEKDQSYSKVLLSHASLYVLGDFQLIDSLKALALYKLHKTLCAFQLDNENISDITDLARYAYSEEGKGFDEGIGGLRGLVCQYMAIHAVELSLDTSFMDLLAEGGQIVKDFFKFQLQRIHNTAGDLKAEIKAHI